MAISKQVGIKKVSTHPSSALFQSVVKGPGLLESRKKIVKSIGFKIRNVKRPYFVSSKTESGEVFSFFKTKRARDKHAIRLRRLGVLEIEKGREALT